MEYILNITDWNVNLYWHNVLIIDNWTHSQVCSILLVKTTQYKSSGISSANLLRALEIFDLPSPISPEMNKCPGSNPVIRMKIISTSEFFDVIGWNTHTSGESRTTRPTLIMIEMANHTHVYM